MKTNQPVGSTANLTFIFVIHILLSFGFGCGKETVTQPSAVSEAPPSNTSDEISLPKPSLPVTVAEPAVSVQSLESLDAIESEMTNYVVDLNAGETPVIEGLVHEITTSPNTPRKKTEDLFALFPRLEADDQRKVAVVALRQVADTDYDLVHPHLLDSTLNPRVLNTFMSDMMKRGATIKLPTLLELARLDGHPLQQESGSLLRTLLNADAGTNWIRWEHLVEARLVSEVNSR